MGLRLWCFPKSVSSMIPKARFGRRRTKVNVLRLMTNVRFAVRTDEPQALAPNPQFRNHLLRPRRIFRPKRRLGCAAVDVISVPRGVVELVE